MTTQQDPATNLISDKHLLHIDLETYSEADLAKCGAYAYAASASFQILLVGFAIDDGPVRTFTGLTGDLKRKLLSPDYIKVAHNASFEMACLETACGLDLDPAQWICTMALASYAGYPASLAGLSAALLGEGEKKLDTGKALIRYFCQPCKPTKANGGRTRNMPSDSPEKWAEFVRYNRQDVEAERAVYRRLKDYLPGHGEHRVFETDHRINRRGIRVDIDLARHAACLSRRLIDDALAKLKDLTGLSNPNSPSQLKEWLASKGVKTDKLTKKALGELMNTDLDPTVREVISLRLYSAKASVKKYDAVLRASVFARVCGMFQYYGASRTGRWAGRIAQWQNAKKNNLYNLNEARETVRLEDSQALRTGWPDVDETEILGQLIRTTLIPSEGRRFIVADYSAIEARVIAWFAGERWRMNVFAHDGDIYKASYSQAFGVPVDEVTKDMRQKGKIMELALGYGGSVNALKAFGADKLGLSDDDLRDLVRKWRGASRRITQLWGRVENAFIDAVQDSTVTPLPEGLEIGGNCEAVYVKLPTGRKLWYRSPVMNEEGLSYMGVNQTSRKWERIRTHGGKLTENLVQAMARDCLAVALLRLEDAGLEVVAHVHDEVIIDAPPSVSVRSVEQIMGSPLSCAKGLYLTAKGYEGNYYFKD